MDGIFIGCDNIYIGNIETIYQLAKCFHYDLDNILNIHSNEYHQEILWYKINIDIFTNK